MGSGNLVQASVDRIDTEVYVTYVRVFRNEREAQKFHELMETSFLDEARNSPGQYGFISLSDGEVVDGGVINE